MIITTRLLPSLGLSVQDALPEQGDSDLSVPSVIVPVASIPLSLSPKPQPAAGTSTVTPWNDSGLSSFTQTLAAAAGLSTTRLWSLTDGFWRFRVDWDLLAPATAITVQDLIASYGDANVGLMPFQLFGWNGSVSGVWPTSGWWEGTFVLPRGHIFRADLRQNNTAGSSVMIASVKWHASKLA